MPVIVSTARAALALFCPQRRVRIVEADQPSIAGIVHGQRVFDSVRTLRTGNDALDHKLHPIPGGFIDDVDVSVKIKQVLECMVLLGPSRSHNSILSEGDN